MLLDYLTEPVQHSSDALVLLNTLVRTNHEISSSSETVVIKVRVAKYDKENLNYIFFKFLTNRHTVQ